MGKDILPKVGTEEGLLMLSHLLLLLGALSSPKEVLKGHGRGSKSLCIHGRTKSKGK